MEDSNDSLEVVFELGHGRHQVFVDRILDLSGGHDGPAIFAAMAGYAVLRWFDAWVANGRRPPASALWEDDDEDLREQEPWRAVPDAADPMDPGGDGWRLAWRQVETIRRALGIVSQQSDDRPPWERALRDVVRASTTFGDESASRVMPALLVYAICLREEHEWLLAADVYGTLIEHGREPEEVALVAAAQRDLRACEGQSRARGASSV